MHASSITLFTVSTPDIPSLSSSHYLDLTMLEYLQSNVPSWLESLWLASWWAGVGWLWLWWVGWLWLWLWFWLSWKDKVDAIGLAKGDSGGAGLCVERKKVKVRLRDALGFDLGSLGFEF